MQSLCHVRMILKLEVKDRTENGPFNICLQYPERLQSTQLFGGYSNCVPHASRPRAKYAQSQVFTYCNFQALSVLKERQ
jgi:hypothetical protein